MKEIVGICKIMYCIYEVRIVLMNRPMSGAEFMHNM